MKKLLLVYVYAFTLFNASAQAWKSFNILSGNPSGSLNQICTLNGTTGCYGTTIATTNGIPSGNNNLPYGAAFDPTTGKLYYSKPGTTAGSSVFNVFDNTGSTAVNSNISTISGGEYFRMGVGQDGNVYGTITANVTTVSASPRIDINTVKLTRYNPATNTLTVLGNIQCPAAYASTMPAPYNDGNYWSSSNATTPYYAAQLGSAGFGDLVVAPDNTMYMTIGKKLITIPNYSSITGTGIIPCVEVGNILPSGVGYNYGVGPGTYGISWDYDNSNLLLISTRASDGADGSYNASPLTGAIAGSFRVNCLATPASANFADLTEVFSSLGCANQLYTVQFMGYPNKFRLTYRIRVENLGQSILKNVQVSDNFQNSYSGFTLSNMSVAFVNNPAGLVLNPSFNGGSNTNLLDGTKTLYGAIYKGANLNGGTGNITPGSNYAVISVSFDVSGLNTASTVYSNSASASAVGFDGSTITDISNNGPSVVNSTGNLKADDPGEDAPTALKFGSTVSGTLWNDVNNSAANTFNNIFTSGETGANVTGMYAILVDPITGLVIGSAPVSATGTYTFTNAPSFSNLQMLINTTPGVVGSMPPVPSITSGWMATSPLITNTTGYVNTGTFNAADLVNFGAADDINVDFGIQRPPVSAVNLQSAIGNPGGYNNVTIPPSAFQNSSTAGVANTQDFDGGTVTALRITTFPTYCNSITINNVTYTNGGVCPPGTTCTSWPASGITIPYTNGTGPSQNISIDPVDGNVDVVISFFAVDNAGAASASPGSVTIPLRTITLTGLVWDDADGNLIQNGSEQVVNGTNTGAGVVTGAVLTINLVDASGKIIATAPVQTNGTYSLQYVPQSTTGLVLQLSQNAGSVGNNQPITQIPSGWVNTGENKNGQAGSADNTPDGQIILTTAAVSITNQNFGIERLPVATAQNYVISQPGNGGTLFLTGNGTSASPAPLAGSDAEDGTIAAGGNFTITDVSGLAGNKLFYNNVQVNTPTVINNYNPALLKVQFSGVGTSSLNFKYSVKDAAGKAAATSATYSITWAYLLAVQNISLTASLSYNSVELKWQTLNEINTSRCYVERSTDGNRFIPVTDLAAAGNITGTYNYSAQDNIGSLTPVDVLYYRVRITDINGKIAYSNVVALHRGAAEGSVRLWPNPVKDVINMSVNSKQATQAQLKLLNVSGQVVELKTVTLSKGINQFDWKLLPNIVKGYYFVELITTDGAIKMEQKIMKE
ncbi:MAG: T9SS type A sorting domain-containing protein [Bacteroidetes bacterium]|nr:T9SS type A sorting domain-containing protein [Bacteroidota bacterium]